MPSMPRLSTPARSQISAPSTPKISGVAMRMAAAQKFAVSEDVERLPSYASASRRADEADAEAQEEAADQHAEQRQRHDEVGDVVRDAGGAAHRVGADEDRRDEDRGGDDAERRQAGEHGDDDAGIAEAGRQVGGEIALQPGHLADAGKPREPAGDQRRRSAWSPSTGMPAKRAAARVLADGADLEAEHRARASGSQRATAATMPTMRPAMQAHARHERRQLGLVDERHRLRPAEASGSLSGPSSIICTKRRTTKLRSSVMTTSSAPKRSLSKRRDEHQQRAGEGAGDHDERDHQRRAAGRSAPVPTARRRARRHRAGPRRRCSRAGRGRRRRRRGR